MENQDMTKLVIDLDYQHRFDYEKRVDLFNKYQIPTNTKYFVPIWELSQFLMKEQGKYFGYFGHGQTILNTKFENEVVNHKIMRIGINKDGKSIVIRKYFHGVKEVPTLGKYRNMLRFDLTNRTISVTKFLIESYLFSFDRDLYDRIDEWLIDFGFNKW